MNRIVAAMFLCFSLLSVYTLWGQEKETLVLIDTDMGKIKVKLYNETPQHRDNFIKLINECPRVLTSFVVLFSSPAAIAFAKSLEELNSSLSY